MAIARLRAARRSAERFFTTYDVHLAPTLASETPVIGHLDLAWSYGFHDLDKMSGGARHRRFHELVAQLVKGSRVGLARGPRNLGGATQWK